MVNENVSGQQINKFCVFVNKRNENLEESTLRSLSHKVFINPGAGSEIATEGVIKFPEFPRKTDRYSYCECQIRATFAKSFRHDFQTGD